MTKKIGVLIILLTTMSYFLLGCKTQSNFVQLAGGTNLGRSLAKIKNEKKLTIGFLGGSITGGAGASAPENNYVSLVSHWFTKNFQDTDFTIINAGIGGTGSNYGAFRVSSVLEKADLVFIEFAVNDSVLDKDAFMKYTEGIVRHLYKINPNIEIVFVDLTTKFIADQYEDNKVPAVVQWHRDIANHYTIDGKNAVLYINPGKDLVNLIKNGNANWVDGFSPMTIADGVHPNNTGHLFIAKQIISALKTAFSVSTPLPSFDQLPSPICSEPMENGLLIDTSESNFDGDWEYIEQGLFPMGINSQLNSKKIGSTLDFTYSQTKYIGVNLIQSDEGGSFEAWIDDGKKTIFSTLGPFTRRDMVLISENESLGNHTLHIRVLSLPVSIISFMTNPSD